jgi:hypothetical protein
VTDNTHPNFQRNYTPTAEEFDQILANTTARALAEKEAERRAKAWPSNVEQLLVAAADRINELEVRVGVLEAGRV